MSIPQRRNPTHECLKEFYVGRDIHNVPKPALVLDRAKMRRHCLSLSHAAEALGVGFRAHVKTHKTVEGTRLQVGDATQVRLVTSTIAEIEHLLPLLKEYQLQGRHVNVLYGIPLPQSQVGRLADVGRLLGRGGLSVLVDHADQLSHLVRFLDEAGFPAGVYLKVDTGYHRAGLPPWGINKDGLVQKLVAWDEQGKVDFTGLYSHSSLSYADSSPIQAMANLEGEITGCIDALDKNSHLFPKNKAITLSVGASPQVTSVENLVDGDGGGHLSTRAQSLRAVLQRVSKGSISGVQTDLELHAGVYSLLDVQQLATRSREQLGECEDAVAISVVTEICSVYNNGERKQPEALASVGVLGLGREPCAAYPGWGIVERSAFTTEPKPRQRLMVSRVSQEHSIIAWEHEAYDGKAKPIPLHVGQSIRIYPNHACITGALYGWYLVVDSEMVGKETEIVDVWSRAGGW